MKNIEILSPAGDIECFNSALKFGANAIYLGGEEFGMRTASKNFSYEDLRSAVGLAHKANVKVYVTCNTLPRNKELERMPEYLLNLNEIGVDAIITTDIGVMSMIQKYAPDVDIHISTQAGIVNYMSARKFYEMGATRVVLARELTLDEISEIRAKTDKNLEIECFVHGAMCMSFSGRCLISNYLTSRDANRGDCAQPCRWKYYLTEQNRKGEYYPINQEDNGSYFFNSRDLCMIENIKEVIEAGVDSLKIEGRAKSAYYVGVVTNAYRAGVEAYKNNDKDKWYVEEVNKISHRAYSKGFFFGNEPLQQLDNGGYIREWEVVGVTTGYNNGEIELTQRNKFYKGDTVEILEPMSKPFEIKIDKMYDEYHNEIENAPHATQKVYIPYKNEVKQGAYIRKRR